jgi:hypothetical protein
MKKSRKRTLRGSQYRALAAGYAIMKSPVAGSFSQAADHYDETDPPAEAPTGTDKVTEADPGETAIRSPIGRSV